MKRPMSALCGAVVLVVASSSLPAAAQPEYDVIIENGTIVDGSGGPAYQADVAVDGDRIAAIGNLGDATAAKTVDASGKHVAPGFIDRHTHAADGLTSPELSAALPQLAQGVTTVGVNPDGGGAVSIPEQRRDLLEDGLGVNVMQMVPHGSVRAEVMGNADRAPTDVEMQ
ncbi:MAG TPA: hypothetical protein VK053_22150, partial [Jiangellaceae bacterium]|nr:hypothetical protein [Jiangellaceae bacterium]